MRVRKHSTIRKLAIHLQFGEGVCVQCSKQSTNMHRVYRAIEEAGEFKYKADMEYLVVTNVNCQDWMCQSCNVTVA